MKKYVPNQVFLFIYWLLLLFIGKAFFLSFHYSKTSQLEASDILKIFGYGLRLDFSAAAYFSVIPFLHLLFTPPIPARITRKLVNYYAIIITSLVTLLVSADLQLYSIWGFRLDATPLQYLSTPSEMLASTASAPLLLLFILFLAQISLALFLYFRFFKPDLSNHHPRAGYYLLSFCLLIILVLPIRGGWQQIPINQSDVYFSDKIYANHAAVNVPWNVGYSLYRQDKETNPYQYLPENEAQDLVQELYTYPPVSGNILKTQKPNVLFIILESYTAKLVGSLGGEKGITPELDKLVSEGILFDKFYASGDRSEKGLVALLSGYPVQTTTSIVKIPRKAERLPHLSKTLKKAGYATSYYYGGELAFANIKSYLLTAGYNRLVSKPDFPAKDYNSKWGVHDHVLLERVFSDLKTEKQPFFSTVFTLSSHEPYDVPMETKFPGEDEVNKFRNSFYYTDQAIGNFIRSAKKEPWWQNTLVVLVADHGHTFPDYEGLDTPGKFRIPLILTGGALAQTGKTISTVASQTDLAYSLLKQLNLPNQDFKWGKDLFNDQAKPFAFYVFNDGFGYLTDKGNFSFDNVSQKEIMRSGEVSEKDLQTGKAYMQVSFEDFLQK
ncbi:LTA synthase family protein [Adhaeribacter soli]|uniref:Sulfatase-like hydrolase/transferase n=1 Tax=Adhaeribacter soli TaxID=2607655 RepID=A0A5N1JB92_9BACT|nr:alkaline phosphatase family protein [Adhaeribacter soli]KAA9346139.1 sulfatase-like hydrolase/transferase [Adhaeribacter soli]